MSDKISRREFVVTSTAGLAAAAAAPAFGESPSASPGQAPSTMMKKSAKPVVIASGNGPPRRSWP